MSQIPALLLSLSTGIIVTRAATEHDLGHDVVSQLSRFRRIVRVTGIIILILALVPGLPKLPFLVVGGLVIFIGTRLPKDATDAKGDHKDEPTLAVVEESPETLAAGMAVEPLSLELGVELIDLVQPDRGGDLLDRVKSLRRNIAMELGIVMPRVHTRDDLDLPHADYAIKVRGIEVARGQAPRGQLLAIGENLDAALHRHRYARPGLWWTREVDSGPAQLTKPRSRVSAPSSTAQPSSRPTSQKSCVSTRATS